MLEFTRKNKEKIAFNFDHIVGVCPSLNSTMIYTSMGGVLQEFLVVESYETVLETLKRYAMHRHENL